MPGQNPPVLPWRGSGRSLSDYPKKYQKDIEEFDKYFKMKKNVIYERACFNRHNQLPEESVDRFIKKIHSLADSCKFGAIEKNYSVTA